MSSNPFGYSDAVWSRFHIPDHAGDFGSAAGVKTAQAGTSAARSVLRLQLQSGKARFKAFGCPVTIAVGEWLAEQAEQLPAAEFKAITAAKIRQALEIADDKAHCALMGEDVVKAI